MVTWGEPWGIALQLNRSIFDRSRSGAGRHRQIEVGRLDSGASEAYCTRRGLLGRVGIVERIGTFDLVDVVVCLFVDDHIILASMSVVALDS
jgi:hypothetical protein